MRRIEAVLLAIGCSLAGVAACGDDVEVFDDGGGTGGSSGASLDEVCGVLPERICASRQPCCEEAGFGYDEAACVAEETDKCRDNVDAVRAGDLAYDPSTIDACIDLADEINERCYLPVTESLALLDEAFDACSNVFRGDKEEGDPCTLAAECAVPENGTAGCSEETNLCVQLRIRDEGESCNFADADFCADGLYCDMPMPMTTGTCQPSIDLGDDCDPIADAVACGLGAYCEADTGTCTEAKPGGATCTFAIECESLQCGGGTCAELDPAVDEGQCG
jgi:hypothetical protein